jgi:pSer/pThr/pTyr-binding forkhead associated (FHA) protein
MQGHDGGERTFAVQKQTIVIGRETTCDVRVPVPSVEQKHCQITIEDGLVKCIDLRSERGTFHNGNRVEQATLVHDDTLTIGPVTFVVRLAGDNGTPHRQVIIERQE